MKPYLMTFDYSEFVLGVGFRKLSDKYRNLPQGELPKPLALQYTCRELGSVVVVAHNSGCYIQVSDLARINRLTREQLHAFIVSDQFATLRLCGGGDSEYEFVNWSAGELISNTTAEGHLLIAWMQQKILIDLLGTPDCKNLSISAKLLNVMVSNHIEFAIWKKMFFYLYQEEFAEIELTDSEELAIPLSFAKRFVLDNFSFSAVLAYVLMRETEITASDKIHESLLSLFRSVPNYLGRIDSRELHRFLKTDIPFLDWMFAIIGDSDLKGEWFPVADANHENQDTEGIVELFLSIHAAITISLRTPTVRGRLMGEYMSKSGFGR